VILAVDTGTATLGWALVSRRGMVHDLGALLLKRDQARSVHDDYLRRVEKQADVLGALLPGVTMLVGEALSFARSAKATASVSLCWGMLVALSRTRGVRLWSVPPKRWQHALLHTPARQPVDYDVLARRITEHVARTAAPKARSAVAALKASERTHALDAAGIGIYTATIADTREAHA
jgi:hypothetical protein